MAAIWVPLRFPALLIFAELVGILYHCEVSLLWPTGSEVTKKQRVCKHHLLMNRGSYQRQTHLGPGVNILSRIQVSMIKIKSRGRDAAVIISAWYHYGFGARRK